MRWPITTLFLTLAAVGCGSGPEGDASGPESPEAGATADTGTTGAPGEDPGGTLPPMEVTGLATDTVLIRSEGPALQFLPDRLSAESGARLLIRYQNAGDLPHNFALFDSEDAIDASVTAAYEAESTGYVPPSAGPHLVAYSPLVSPGQTIEMELVVPPPGEYTYICLFPGHAQMMLGTLVAR